MRSRQDYQGEEADVDKNVDLIRRYCEALEAARQKYDGVTIRYEDLTADPESTLRPVCRHLGVAFEPGMLEYGDQDHGRFKSGPRRLERQDQERAHPGARAAARGDPRVAAADRRHVGLPAADGRGRDVLRSSRESRRRRLLGPLAVALHRAVLGALALPRPPRARRAAGGPVRFLLAHAWGFGGTIRTTLTLSGALAATRDVEIVSVLRRRERPFFPIPAGVRVRALEDRRAPSPVARVLGRLPSLLDPPR